MANFIKYIIIIVLLLFGSVTLYAQVTVAGKDYTVEECLKNADAFEKQEDYRSAANFLNGVAFYLWEKRDYDEAITHFNYSISLNEKINNDGGIAGIQSNLGMIYNDKKEYSQALSAFQKALTIRIAQRERMPILKTRINISVVLNNLERFDESIQHLNEALKLAKELNDTDEIKTCYASLAETYEKKGDHQTSMLYFDKYKLLYEGIHREREAKIKASLEKVQQNLELTSAEKNQKEVQLAIKEKELYDKQQQISLNDSAKREMAQRITDTDAKLKLLEKEEAINELRRQKIEAKLKQEQQIRGFIIISLIVALVFLIIFYNALRRNKRLNRLLVERNDEIIQQKRAIEEENKIRTKLLSILSHDLRTPLSAVYLFIQILRSKTLSAEMVEVHLAKLEASLNSSFQMLDNMLYWAKNQVSGIKYNPEIVNIVDIVEDNLRLLSTNIQNKSIEIDNQVTNINYVYADKEMVNIILRNLISNAVKFTPVDGVIRLTDREDNGYIIIGVQDTGVGITKEQQAKLFTAQMHSNTGTAKESGTGLGLVLVHDFVEICKGKITFETKENEGTTFYISLPLATQQQLKTQRVQ